ncbi:MAG: rhomboid family intramembrane serine protease, partial [Planctomycetota bacterium]
MGLQERQYYQDSYSNPFATSLDSGKSMITMLIVINVAIFVADMFFPAISRFLAMKPTELPTYFWQLLTYGFAHAPITSKESFFHVGGNMLVLFFLGRSVEEHLGSKEFLKFYLVAILAAGIGFFLLNISEPGLMLGASGAVSAVVALFIFLFPKRTLLLMGVIP